MTDIPEGYTYQPIEQPTSDIPDDYKFEPGYTGSIPTELDRGKGWIDTSDYLDKNIPYGTNIYEGMARNQTAGDKWVSGLIKGTATFVTATGESYGAVLGAMSTPLLSALGSNIDADIIFKNPIVTFFEDLNEEVAANNPHYYTQKEINDSVLQNMATTNFYSDKVLNGIGFLASALFTGGVAMKGATAFTAAMKGANTSIIKALLRNKLPKAVAKHYGMSKGGQATSRFLGAVQGRVGESVIEANDVYKRTSEELIAEREANGNTLSDREIEEIAQNARNTTFGLNMLLAIPDAYQLGKFFKTVNRQKVGRGLFGGSRVGHAAEQALIESQEENFQLAVANAAMNIAGNNHSREGLSDASEYFKEVAGGMMDNFKTKEGQESMVLGGLLGGGMGILFQSNESTEKARKRMRKALIRSKLTFDKIVASQDLARIEELAIEKQDWTTVQLIQDLDLMQTVYTAMEQDKTEDKAYHLQTLKSELKGLLEITEELETDEKTEVVQRIQRSIAKIDLYEDFYNTIEQENADLPAPVRGHLFYGQVTLDALNHAKNNLAGKLGYIKTLPEGTDMTLPVSMPGSTQTFVPEKVLAEQTRLDANIAQLQKDVKALKTNKKLQDKIVQNAKMRSATRSMEVTKDDGRSPIGYIQERGKPGNNIHVYERTENEDGTISYQIKNDKGEYQDFTVNPEEYPETIGTIDFRGTKQDLANNENYEMFQAFRRPDGKLKYIDQDKYNELMNILATDPNWKDKIRITVHQSPNKYGDAKSRIAAYLGSAREGGAPIEGTHNVRSTNIAGMYLVPSSAPIDFHVEYLNEKGEWESMKHWTADPYKFKNAKGEHLDLRTLNAEQFFKMFRIWGDNNIEAFERRKNAQAQLFEFYDKVAKWMELNGIKEGTEIPKEFYDTLLGKQEYDFTEPGEWTSIEEHEDMLVDPETGLYNIIDVRKQKRIGDGKFFEPPAFVKKMANEQRYFAILTHPTYGPIWVAVGPGNLSNANKKAVLDLINNAIIEPKKELRKDIVDQINDLMYIAYGKNWNIKFDSRSDGLYIDIFNRPEGINIRNIRVDDQMKTLGDIAKLVNPHLPSPLTPYALKNGIAKENITNAEIKKAFSVSVKKGAIKGINLKFQVKPDKIVLKEDTTKTTQEKRIDRQNQWIQEAKAETDPIKKANLLHKILESSRKNDIPILSQDLEGIALPDGYELAPLLGTKYSEGMNVIADFREAKEGEEDGQIVNVRKPQIMKDGVMVQAAEIVVAKKAPADTSVETTDDLIAAMRAKAAENMDQQTEDDSDEVFKKSDKKAKRLINYKDALKYLRRVLPPGIKTKDIETVLKNLEDQKYTWGKFKRDTIYLSQYAEEGTQYHEAFHAVFRTLLTEEQRNKLYREAIKKYGKGFQPLYYEEKMADEFMQWKLDRTWSWSNPLRALFNIIMDWGNALFKNQSETDAIFRGIDQGAFSSVEPVILDIYKNDEVFKLLRSPADYLRMNVVTSEEIIYGAAGYVIREIQDLIVDQEVSEEQAKSELINQLVNEFMDSRAQEFNPTLEVNLEIINSFKGQERESALKRMIGLEQVYKDDINRLLVQQEVKKIMSAYDISAVAATEEELSEDEVPEHRWDLHQGEYGGWKNVSKEIKQFIATTTYEGVDSLFGKPLTRAIDFVLTFQLMQRRLANKNRGEQLDALERLAKFDPQVNAVYQRLIRETGYDPDTGEAPKNPRLFTRFMKTFELEEVDYLQVLRTYDFEEQDKAILQTLAANRMDTATSHFLNWERKSSTFNVFSNQAMRNAVTEELRSLNKAFDKDLTVDEGQIRPEIVNEFIKVFTRIGIDFSVGYVTESLEVYHGLRDDTGFSMITQQDLEVFIDLIAAGDNLFLQTVTEEGEVLDDTGARGRLIKLARGDVKYRSDIYESTFANAENKTIFGFVLPSYILTKIRELRQTSLEAFKEEFGNNPYHKYNILLQDENLGDILKNMTPAFTGDFRDAVRNQDGVTFKHTTPKELLLTWHGLFNNDKDYYPVVPMIYEAKSTSIAINMPKKNYLDDQGRISNETTELILNTLFAQEHARMRGEIDINQNKKLDNVWVNLPFMQNEKFEGKLYTEYTMDEILSNEELKREVKKSIYKGLLAEVAAHKTDLENNGLLDEAGELSTITNIDEYLRNFVVNDFINSITISQLLQGDLSTINKKSLQEVMTERVKRNGGEIAFGPHMGEGTYKIVNKTEDKYLDKDGNEVNSDDAGVYTSVKRRIAQLEALGRLSTAQRKVYEKIDAGEELTEEEIQLIDGIPLKTVYYDGETYHKMSETMLTKEFTSEKNEEGVWVAKEGMEKLHNMREYMDAHDVQAIVPISASKLQKKSQVVSDKEFENWSGEEFETTVLENRNMRLQVENQSGKEKIVQGTQMLQLINLLYESNPELHQEYYRLLEESRTSDFNFAELEINNVKRFSRKLIETMEETGEEGQILKLLTATGDKFDYNLNLPHTVEKVEQIFLSHFAKNSLRQKVPGYKLTLMSSSGVKYKGRDLQMHRLSEDGKTILPAEVMMTRRTLAKIIGYKGKIEDIKDVELLQMVGSRIPTQAHHSMIPFQVVDFLPEYYGDTIIAPAGITTLSGADYDIDSLFVYRKEFYIDDATGEAKLFGSAETIEQEYHEFLQYYEKQHGVSRKDIEELADTIVPGTFPQGFPDTLQKFKQLSPAQRINNYARTNKILDIYLQVLTDPNVSDLFVPATMDNILNAATWINDKIKKKGGVKTQRPPGHYTVAGKLRAYIANATGKHNISPVAVANAVSAFMTKHKVYLQKPITFLGEQYGSYAVLEEKDIEFYEDPETKEIKVRPATINEERKNLSKIDSLSTLVSAMTDDAKYGLSALLNLERTNLSVFANMLALGMGFNRTMLFASQEILVELSTILKNNPQLRISDGLKQLKNVTTSKIKRTYQKQELTDRDLVDNLTERDPVRDLYILEKMSDLSEAASDFMEVNTMLALNKGQVGITIDELNDIMDRIQVKLNKEESKHRSFSNFTEKYREDTNTSNNVSLLNRLITNMRPFFLTMSTMYGQIRNYTLPMLRGLRQTERKRFDRAIKSYLTAAGLRTVMAEAGMESDLSIYNALINPDMANDKFPKTLAQQIQDLGNIEKNPNAEEFKKNEFIKILRVVMKYNANGTPNQKNETGLDIVESIMSVRKSPLAVDRVVNGFAELLVNYPKFAKNFLRYALVKESLQFKRTSFTKFIDVAQFASISQGLDKVLNGEIQVSNEEFAKVFLLHVDNADLIDVPVGIDKRGKITSGKFHGFPKAVKEELQVSDPPMIFKLPTGEGQFNVYLKTVDDKENGSTWEIVQPYGVSGQMPYHMTYAQNIAYDKALKSGKKLVELGQPKPEVRPIKKTDIVLELSQPKPEVTKKKSRVDKSKKWNELKDLPVYSEAGVNTMRKVGTDEHFGNPFTGTPSVAKKNPDLILMPSVKDAVDAYVEWLTTDVYNQSRIQYRYISDVVGDNMYKVSDLEKIANMNMEDEVSLAKMTTEQKEEILDTLDASLIEYMDAIESNSYPRELEQIIKEMPGDWEFVWDFINDEDAQGLDITQYAEKRLDEVREYYDTYQIDLFDGLNPALNINPKQKEWILDQIRQGKLDNQTLLYMSDRGNYRSHADALQDIIDHMRPNQGTVDEPVAPTEKPEPTYKGLTVDQIFGDPNKKFQKVNPNDKVAAEKTVRDLATRLASRIGIGVRFVYKPDADWKGVLQDNGQIAVINLSYATEDTPVHEIIGHPLLAAIKKKSYLNPEAYDAVRLSDIKGNEGMSGWVIVNYETPQDFPEVYETESDALYAITRLIKNPPNSTLYDQLLNELETPRGKKVLERIKRDYKIKSTKTVKKVAESLEEKIALEVEGYKHVSITEEGFPIYAKEEAEYYTEEEQQDEALVELLGLYVKDRLDAVKDKSLIAVLKRVWAEMRDTIKSLFSKKVIDLYDFPDDMTLGELSDIIAYRNSKIVLPGYKVEYRTPDGELFRTYAEASAHLSSLLKRDVPELENLFVRREMNEDEKLEAEDLQKQLRELNEYSHSEEYRSRKAEILKKQQEYINELKQKRAEDNPEYYPETYLNYETAENYGLEKFSYIRTQHTDKRPGDHVKALPKGYSGYYLFAYNGTGETESVIMPITPEAARAIWLEDGQSMDAVLENEIASAERDLRSIEDDVEIRFKQRKITERLKTITNPYITPDMGRFLERNKMYEVSYKAIEEWKERENIVYNPEEVYTRGQGFYSSIGAYTDLDVEALLANMVDHILDLEKAGGELVISAFTKPLDKKVDHLDRTSVRYVIYPQPQDIKWAAPADVYSGSTWNAAQAVGLKSPEVGGVSYTKAPGIDSLSAITPNLADIIDKRTHHHNELGIALTTTNFRLEYDDNLDTTTKQLIDNINQLLEDKFGPVRLPDYVGMDMRTKTTKVWNLFAQSEGGTFVLDTFDDLSIAEGVRDTINNELVEAGEAPDYYLIETEKHLPLAPEKTEKDLTSNLQEIAETKLSEARKLNLPVEDQAIINLKVAQLKEGYRKYPRSLIISKVKQEFEKFEEYSTDLPFQKLSLEEKQALSETPRLQRIASDDYIKGKATTSELISYNFNRAIQSLSKRFNIPVELVNLPEENWRGVYSEGTVYLNLAHLRADTPFHEFAHPFVLAVEQRNPEVYQNLVTEILENHPDILEKVQRLYPELSEEDQIQEAVVQAIGQYAAEEAPTTLAEKVKAFLKEIARIISDTFFPGSQPLISELHPETSLKDIAILMAKGTARYDLSDMTSEQAQYQKDFLEASKLIVQADHVEDVRKGTKTISLRDPRMEDAIYKEGKNLIVYADSKHQGMMVKVKSVSRFEDFNKLTDDQKDRFAKALGYESFADFKKQDKYANEDSADSIRFPGVYKFLKGEQAMDIISYELVDDNVPIPLKTKLQDKINNFRKALVEQIDYYKSKITSLEPENSGRRAFVEKQERLLDVLNVVDDIQGLAAYIQEAQDDLRKARVRLEDTIERLQVNLNAVKGDYSKLNEKTKRELVYTLFELKEFNAAYQQLYAINSAEIKKHLGETELAEQFIQFKEDFEVVRDGIEEQVVPVLASWLLEFANMDQDILKEELMQHIERIKNNPKLSEEKKQKRIDHLKEKYEDLFIDQKSLEEQLKLAPKDISIGAMYLEAAISSSDQATSLFAKALKYQHFKANLRDLATQDVIGEALEDYMRKVGSKVNNPDLFYKDFFKTIKVKVGTIDGEAILEDRMVFVNEIAGSEEKKKLLQVMKDSYRESLNFLPEQQKDRMSIKQYGDEQTEWLALPYIRKSAQDQLREKGLIAYFKHDLQEIWKPMATDDSYGYRTQNNEAVQSIPVYYTTRGEGIRAIKNEEISKDLASSVLRFAQMAHRFHEFKEVQAQVELLKETISQRDVTATNPRGDKVRSKVASMLGLDGFSSATTKRVNERLLQFIDMQYYGVQEEPWIISLGQYEIDFNKLLNFIGKWTGMTTLAVNFLSALNNVLLGNMYMYQEALARQNFGNMQFNLARGKKLYHTGTIRMFSDIGKLSGLSKETQIVRLYDAIQGDFTDISGNFITGTKAKKLWNTSSLFFLNHAGEHEMQVSLLFAAMDAQQVKTKDGKTISLWEAYELNDKGKLVLKEGVEWTEKQRFEFMNKLHATNKSLHGNYNDFDKTLLQKSVIGRLILMFRKFIAPGIRRRFGALAIDNEADELHEGFFRTTFRLLTEETHELKNFMLFNEHKLTDYEKANVKKFIFELGSYLSLIAMFMLAAGALGDDEDGWAKNLLLYEIKRLQTELGFYLSPTGEFLKILKSPAATQTLLQRMYKLGDQLTHTLMFDYDYTHYKVNGKGHRKGDSKLWDATKDLIPVLQGIERSTKPGEARKFFDKLY